MLTAFFNDDGGSTAIEYAMVASLIAVVILGSLNLLAQNTGLLYEEVASGVE